MSDNKDGVPGVGTIIGNIPYGCGGVHIAYVMENVLLTCNLLKTEPFLCAR